MTSRASGWALPPPSSSRAASRRTACSRSWSAPPPQCLLLCQCLLTRLSLTIPIAPLARSLEGNDIGDDGAFALADVLKETTISNLKCATAPLSCQRPLTLLSTCLLTALAGCEATNSVPEEQPPSLKGSRATRRCKCSSKPTGTRTGLKRLPFCQRPLTPSFAWQFGRQPALWC